jgi:hypothetical protein
MKVRKVLLFEPFANGNFLEYAMKFIILHIHKSESFMEAAKV